MWFPDLGHHVVRYWERHAVTTGIALYLCHDCLTLPPYITGIRGVTTLKSDRGGRVRLNTRAAPEVELLDKALLVFSGDEDERRATPAKSTVRIYR
jgi:hypothetical protein